ncbi:MAG: hypothetical protein M3Q09_02260 [Gemmatimonadota bacterium]|nr:hypothetical protein [Gemmatimonadota bacterium]
MTMRAFVCLAGVAAVTACATPSQPLPPGEVTTNVSARLGNEFDLAVGQTARIAGTPVTLLFRSVAEDSRCPVDVQCVWAGNGRTILSLSASGVGTSEVSLNTTTDPRITTYAGYRIRLAGLKPPTRAGVTIPPASYVATFEVAAP